MDQQQPLPGGPPLEMANVSVGSDEGDHSPATRNPRPSPRGTAAYQRRRAVKACQVCRARRTKCDNLKPSCSFCLKTGAKCIQSPVDLSSFDPASLKILERLDELEELLRAPTGAPTSTDDARAPSSSGARPLPRQTNTTANADLGIDKGMVLPPHVETVMAWPILQPIVTAARTQTWAGTGSTPLSVAASHRSVGAGLAGLEDEPRRVRELLDSFFSHVHVKNPILDETSTRVLVQSTVLNGIDWSAESCLALLILALGAVATPLGPSHSTMPGSAAYTEAQSYFHAAQKRLGVVMTSDHTIAPQCLFLAGVYLMCNFQPREAWRCFVQALAGCQHFAFLSLGSQREYHNALAEDPHHRDHSTDRFQQAVYWSSWKSEREGRAHFPHLQDFGTDDHNSGTATTSYPSFFPTPPGPRMGARMHSGTSRAGIMTVGMMVTSESLQDERERTSWYFYLSEISLRRLCARIGAELLELREKHASCHPDFLAAVAANVPSYEEQTLDWIRSLPACLSFDAPPDKDDVCRFVLRGQALDIYEMICWPFLSAFLAGDGAQVHGQIGDDDNESLYQQLAQKGLDYHLYRLVVNKPGYQHRHHGTVYMMHTCYRSSLVLVAAATKCAHVPVCDGQGDPPRRGLSMPAGWHQSVTEMLSLLTIWSSETSEFDQARSILETGLISTLAE
ncbi:C6 zinc finger domain-containing protein [Magnaporthiopsis poae ATCC 64411]|uniref:C6 zinc finger domain-containing protein n=1 Tax=Magnaporthiopsis poae (strain ATCC 64411 / 73-15) TaxID=644358 RepID=A0A0C4E9S9_MAGP6|nr:C6 zinc finger domain-containing protein [Magnaporthiopsis poae ATCC 64411]